MERKKSNSLRKIGFRYTISFHPNFSSILMYKKQTVLNILLCCPTNGSSPCATEIRLLTLLFALGIFDSFPFLTCPIKLFHYSLELCHEYNPGVSELSDAEMEEKQLAKIQGSTKT